MSGPFRIGAVVLALAGVSVPTPSPTLRQILVGPIGASKAGMELVFEPNGVPCGETIRGTLTLFGSAPGVPVEAPLVSLPEGGCTLRFDYPFVAISPDLVGRSNLNSLEWSLTGERRKDSSPKPIAWKGNARREAVTLTEAMKVTLRRFVAVRSLAIGEIGLESSTVYAVLEVTNPLSFDLRIAEAAYELTVDGKIVASGRTGNLLLHARRGNRLELPVELDHVGLLAAAGKAAIGKGVAGVLSGVGKLRLPAGDLEFPFEFPVTLSR